MLSFMIVGIRVIWSGIGVRIVWDNWILMDKIIDIRVKLSLINISSLVLILNVSILPSIIHVVNIMSLDV